ncbi:MAG: TolC family protein, partial [Pseudomonadota bacterium]
GRRQAAVALESLTGETAPPCQTTTSSAGEVAAAWDDPARIERIIERAVAANPNLEALRRSSASLDAQAQRQARARLPVLDVVGIASFASQNFDGGLDFQNRVGVNVSVPLYSGNALGARTRQAESRAARAYGEVAQAERLLREDVTIAYQRVLLLSAQAERQAEVRDLKLQQFEGAEAEQRIGRRTLPELVEIRLEFEGAAIAEINARYALRLEALRLDALTGDILKGR